MRALLLALLLHNTNALSTATLPPPKLATASTPTLALPFAELSQLVGGKGRARSIWDAVRSGQEPLDAAAPTTIAALMEFCMPVT